MPRVLQLKLSAGNTPQEQLPGVWFNLTLLPCSPPKCCVLKSCQPGWGGGGESSETCFWPPGAASAIKLKGREYSCHSQGLASTLYPCRGQANLTREIAGEFIYLFLFCSLHKMAWKLKELIISFSILSFSTWLVLALLAHLFIGFKGCTVVNCCPSR